MRSTKAVGKLAEANELLSRGELDQAEELLREILRHDAQLSPALTLCGVIAQLRGRSEAAIDMVKRALAINPDDAVAYVTCGQAYRATGNLPAAEESLRNALRVDPNRHDAHLNLALTLWSAGEHARAVTYFKNVLLLTKQSFQAYFYLAQIYQENGEFSSAEECFRSAVSIQPKHIEASLLLGRLLLTQGRIPDAFREFERGVAGSPADVNLRLAAACAAFELGHEDSALSHLQVAFELEGVERGGVKVLADRGRSFRFDVWCQDQKVELVRVAKQQRHRVRSATTIPAGDLRPDNAEPETPDVFVAGLRKCGVLPGDQLLFSRDKKVCIEGVMTRPLHRPFTSPHIVKNADDGRMLMRVPDRQLNVSISCAYLGAADNFFDWIFECVTRLWAYQQRPICKDLPLLVPAGLTHWQNELLALLGYEESRLIHVAEDSMAQCDELFVASLSAPANFVAPFALEHLRRGLRKSLLPGLGTPSRIFVTRQEMSTRRLAHFHEIAPILARHGFQLIPANSVDIQDMFQMFQSAEIIVGTEGAAMANVFMAPAHAKIVLLTADELQAVRYAGPSLALGQEFNFMRCEPVYESNPRLADCDIHLDSRVFDEYLSKL